MTTWTVEWVDRRVCPVNGIGWMKRVEGLPSREVAAILAGAILRSPHYCEVKILEQAG